VAAIGTEELDFLVAEFVPVTIKFAIALRAGHPKYFRHICFPLIFDRAKPARRKAINFSISPNLASFARFARENSSRIRNLSRQVRQARKGWSLSNSYFE
jgi:hypothetical protein